FQQDYAAEVCRPQLLEHLGWLPQRDGLGHEKRPWQSRVVLKQGEGWQGTQAAAKKRKSDRSRFLLRKSTPNLVACRFASVVEFKSGRLRLQEIAHSKEIEEFFVAHREGVTDGEAENAFPRANRLIAIHDELQVFLVATHVKTVVTKNGIKLDPA